MNTQKIAITIPKDLITIVDAISRDKGLSRSKYISLIIKENIFNERDQYLKEAYNRVFSDEAMKKEQLDTANWFQRAGSNEGQEW